jgi:hypothetical protein
MTAHGVDRSGAAGGSGGVENPIPVEVVDAAGDLIVGSAPDTVTRLAVGATGALLVADSAQALKMKWQTFEDFLEGISALTEDTTPDTAADSLLTFDDSASTVKRSLIDTVVGRAVNGAFRSVQRFTASGTWTKPAGLKRIKVRLVGGGGGSGGVGTTAGAQASVSAGGSSGGYSEKVIEAASLGATETVTIGAGGIAGVAGATKAGDGGTTSFGAHCQATGGTGSTGIGARGDSYAQFAPAPGVGSGGDINLFGTAGHIGFANGPGAVGVGGAGGASHLGGSDGDNATGTTSVGSAGKNYGSGAQGSANGASQTQITGAAGSAGIVIVEEFF